MKAQAFELVVVGADRIARNGDTANKIGTYALAILAAHHGIPFYVAAPRSTFDFPIRSGEQIPIEERAADEVSGIPRRPHRTGGRGRLQSGVRRDARTPHHRLRHRIRHRSPPYVDSIPDLELRPASRRP